MARKPRRGARSRRSTPAKFVVEQRGLPKVFDIKKFEQKVTTRLSQLNGTPSKAFLAVVIGRLLLDGIPIIDLAISTGQSNAPTTSGFPRVRRSPTRTTTRTSLMTSSRRGEDSPSDTRSSLRSPTMSSPLQTRSGTSQITPAGVRRFGSA